MADTITFSPIGDGWNSRHSFEPEWMIGMNGNFFTFKNGEIYKHNVNNTRCEYYGSQYNSEVTTIINEAGDVVKMFETMVLDSLQPWKAEITTELSTGTIESSYFKEKEGKQYAYIRRNPSEIDMKAVSTQGVGYPVSYAALVITFGFNISASISEGDAVYISDGSTMTLVGNIDSHTNTTVTLDAAAVTPSQTTFIVVVKSSLAESHGARGEYMEIKLTNTDTINVELSGISSEAFQSLT